MGSLPVFEPADGRSRSAGRLTTVLLLIAAVAVGPAACRSGNFANENDRLRAQVKDLEDEVQSLRRTSAELEAALAATGTGPAAGDDEIRESTPRVVGVEVSRLSHVRFDDSGSPLAVVWLEPRDGRGRFVQMVGTLSVTVALIAEDGTTRTIGSTTLSPGPLRDAYRSGFAGTHYVIAVPLSTTPAGEIDARVFFNDALTGLRHEAGHALAVRTGDP